MKSLFLQQPFSFQYSEAELDPVPAPHEVLLKIHRVGICGTDYHAYKGKQPFFSYPRRLGHELGAEIVALGSGVDAQKYPLGSRVSVEPYLNCGHCQPCRNGKSNCCEKLQVLGVHTDGGMCEYLKVPAAKVHISEKLSFEQLALVETLAIGCHAVARAQIHSGDSVLVIGAGPIGLSVTEFARMTGARICVTDIDAQRLAFCSTVYGVETLLNTGSGFDLEAVLPEKPTIIFDATGNEHSMNETVKQAAHGGKIVFVGLHQGNVTFKDTDFHRRELTLFASRNALPADFTFIIRKMEEGRIDTSKWITHRARFEEAIPAFEEWLRPESRVIKAMLVC